MIRRINRLAVDASLLDMVRSLLLVSLRGHFFVDDSSRCHLGLLRIHLFVHVTSESVRRYRSHDHSAESQE